MAPIDHMILRRPLETNTYICNRSNCMDSPKQLYRRPRWRRAGKPCSNRLGSHMRMICCHIFIGNWPDTGRKQMVPQLLPAQTWVWPYCQQPPLPGPLPNGHQLPPASKQGQDVATSFTMAGRKLSRKVFSPEAPLWMALLFLLTDKRLHNPKTMFSAFSLAVVVTGNAYLLLVLPFGYFLANFRYCIQTWFLTLLFMECSHICLMNFQVAKGSRMCHWEWSCQECREQEI